MKVLTLEQIKKLSAKEYETYMAQFSQKKVVAELDESEAVVEAKSVVKFDNTEHQVNGLTNNILKMFKYYGIDFDVRPSKTKVGKTELVWANLDLASLNAVAEAWINE